MTLFKFRPGDVNWRHSNLADLISTKSGEANRSFSLASSDGRIYPRSLAPPGRCLGSRGDRAFFTPQLISLEIHSWKKCFSLCLLLTYENPRLPVGEISHQMGELGGSIGSDCIIRSKAKRALVWYFEFQRTDSVCIKSQYSDLHACYPRMATSRRDYPRMSFTECACVRAVKILWISPAPAVHKISHVLDVRIYDSRSYSSASLIVGHPTSQDLWYVTNFRRCFS